MTLKGAHENAFPSPRGRVFLPVHTRKDEAWGVGWHKDSRRKRNAPKRKRNKKRSTGPSRVVPHRSTTPARTCLTSLFGWEAVSQADMAALKVALEKPVPIR